MSSKHAVPETKKSEGSAISLWLDAYSEIFSDFDPRPFSERMVSDDFITQVKKVSREEKANVSLLKLLVPKGTQKEDDERIIKKRLQTYFYNTYQQMQYELRKIRIRSIYFTISGIGLMVLASYISYLKLTGFHINLALALFEPGSWFLFWTGLELSLSFSKGKNSEVKFYSRMANAHIEFSPYN